MTILDQTGRRAFGHVARRWLAMLTMVWISNSAVQGKDPWIRHFRAGALIGANIDAEFSQSGLFATTPPQSGLFDDGFVLLDNTDNATGRTSNWGYNTASQWDETAETLIFSQSGGFQTTASSTANNDPHFGLDLAYGGTIKRIGRTWLSWELGFSLLPITISDQSGADAQLGQHTLTFSTAGLIPPLAPYTGSPEGGPLLSTNIVASGQTTTNGALSASRTIEVVLYNLRLGPHFHWDVNRRWAIEAMAGVALGLADGRYEYDERVHSATGQASSNGSMRETSWLYGGYVGVLTQVHVERNAYFYGSAQFMSLSNVEFSEAGRSATLRLDQGLYFSVGFTWLF